MFGLASWATAIVRGGWEFTTSGHDSISVSACSTLSLGPQTGVSLAKSSKSPNPSSELMLRLIIENAKGGVAKARVRIASDIGITYARAKSVLSSSDHEYRQVLYSHMLARRTYAIQ